MSFSPPKTDEALIYYRKGYALEPRTLSPRSESGNYSRRPASVTKRQDLRIALADSARNPTVASEAEKALKQMGAL